MKRKICVIGGGASALSFASFIDTGQYEVTIFEQNKTLGRKFLVAGKGGFNLTHAEDISNFKQRYTPSLFLKNALTFFDNSSLVTWLKALNIPTYVGSSNRIYPQVGIKPIQVLKAIEKHILSKGVIIQTEKKLSSWDGKNELFFNIHEKIVADIIVFAVGGGSWKITGSDGKWTSLLHKNQIKTKPFYPSNCAFEIKWHKDFITKHEGTPLKNLAIQCDNKSQKGELVITKFGIEGNAVYALSPLIRKQLNKYQKAEIFIDWKPNISIENICQKLSKSKQKNISASLKTDIKLPKAAIDILKFQLTKEDFLDKKTLAKHIKKCPLKISQTAAIDEAISTVGGIEIDDLDNHFQLKTHPNTYCIGEMVDWDAPTGGYLLQACFSMGAYLAHHLNAG